VPAPLFLPDKRRLTGEIAEITKKISLWPYSSVAERSCHADWSARAGHAPKSGQEIRRLAAWYAAPMASPCITLIPPALILSPCSRCSLWFHDLMTSAPVCRKMVPLYANPLWNNSYEEIRTAPAVADFRGRPGAHGRGRPRDSFNPRRNSSSPIAQSARPVPGSPHLAGNHAFALDGRWRRVPARGIPRFPSREQSSPPPHWSKHSTKGNPTAERRSQVRADHCRRRGRRDMNTSPSISNV
jgi:hypothetical protein